MRHLALMFLLASCAPVQYISVFENEGLVKKLSADQYQTRRDEAYAQCRDEAFKIPLPDFPKISTLGRQGSPEWHIESADRAMEKAYHAALMDRVLIKREELARLCMEAKGWKPVEKVNPEWMRWREDRK